MSESPHALISLEERFAEAILDGMKVVELRRRPMRLSVGTTIWMYVKVPVGNVVGSAQVEATYGLAPSTLWRRFGALSGLSRAEFFDYFAGATRAFGLALTNPTRLSTPLSLEKLRALSSGFQPPQFFTHLAANGALVSAFTGGAALEHVPVRMDTRVSKQATRLGIGAHASDSGNRCEVAR
jgi:predicted transcriptional regulator